MDKQAFSEALERVLTEGREKNGIGTLGEKTLHAVLKEYYEPYCDNREVKVGSFVADIVGENGIIEIQTGNFHRLIKKLDVFLEYCDVTVVYPVASKTKLLKIDPDTGELCDKRTSPKHMTLYDCAPELYPIRFAFDNPRFHLRLCFLEMEETRRLVKKKRGRGKPTVKLDRVPVEFVDEMCFDCVADYESFIPHGLSEEFTCKDFAFCAKTNTSFARMIINILIYLEIAAKIGKDKKGAYIYKIEKQNLQNL